MSCASSHAARALQRGRARAMADSSHASWIKSLEKKLRHIQELHQRVQQGLELDAAQREKLGREAEVRATLEAARRQEPSAAQRPNSSTLNASVATASMHQPEAATTAIAASGSTQSKRRAIEKKLREIDELNAKAGRGEKLDDRQRAKISRESELRASLLAVHDELGQPNAPAAEMPRPSPSQAAAAKPLPPPPRALHAQLEAGVRLRVDGRAAKVKSVLPSGEVRVRYKEDGTKGTLHLPSDDERVSEVRPPKRKREAGEEGDDDDDDEEEEEEEEEENKNETPNGTIQGDARASSSASATASSTGQRGVPVLASAVVTASGLVCGFCGRSGHTPRACTFGLGATERFMCCSGTHPVRCFTRTFIVPLRRASPAFECEALRQGRVDVGVRCVSAALFRSQSLRQNSRVLLCLMGEMEHMAAASTKGGAFAKGGANAKGSAGAIVEGRGARLLEVCGSIVRDLRPDEHSLSRRLRAVSDASGAAAAEVIADKARHALSVAPGAPPDEDGPVGVWSRDETRGLSSAEGDLMVGVRRALDQPGEPPMLLLLSASGVFIGDLCAELASSPAFRAAPSGVVVLLGDDRGLDEEEERRVRAEATARGSAVRNVSLGSDVLFASHAIVLVHHYLDRHLHSCLIRPPREYARGGGRGGGSERGRGKGGGRGRW